MAFLPVRLMRDSKDGHKKQMVTCRARGYKRHPINVCRRYCKKFYGGLVLGGIECNWHPSDGPVEFTPREDRLPDEGDTSHIPDLFVEEKQTALIAD